MTSEVPLLIRGRGAEADRARRASQRGAARPGSLGMERLLAGIAFGLCMAWSASAATLPLYRMTLIPTPAGFDDSVAARVNNLGHVVTCADNYTLSVIACYLWSAEGGYTAISSPSGAVPYLIAALADDDTVVGNYATESGDLFGFVWSPAQGWTDIRTAQGLPHVVPAAINRSGVVVGTMEGIPGEVPERASSFEWTRERGVRILDAERINYAAGINDAGQGAGNIGKGFGRYRATRFDKSGPHALAFPRGAVSTSAVGINASGVLAATVEFDGVATQLATWDQRAGWTLGTNGVAFGFDDQGDILGEPSWFSFDPFLWNPGYGVVSVAESLTSDSPVVDRLDTQAISANGNLAGFAHSQDGDTAAVLIRVQ